MNAGQAVVCLLTGFAIAGSIPQLPAQEPPKPSRIEGRTINARTGEPIRRASITLTQRPAAPQAGVRHPNDSRPRTWVTSSDAGGTFRFPNLPPGRYNLRASKPGFLTMDYGSRPSTPYTGMPVDVGPGQEVTGLEFKISPQAVILGRVLDDEGEVIPNVQIQLLRRRGASGRSGVTAGGATNDIGEFRIANIPSGKYVLAVHPSRRFLESETAGGERPEEYGTTYYPSEASPATAAVIQVTAGAELRGIDVRLKRSRTYRVQGSVMGAPAGQEARSIRVMLIPSDDEIRFRGGRDFAANLTEEGRFQILSVDPGTYTAVAMSLRNRPTTIGKVPVTVLGSDVRDVVIPAGESLVVTGTVRVDPPNAEISLSSLRILMMPVDSLPYSSTDAPVGKDGDFRMENVSRERYYPSISGAALGTYYVKSVKEGGRELAETILDFSAGGSAGPLEITVGAASASVEGVVLEQGKPSSGRFVVLIPQGTRLKFRNLHRQANSDADGRFRITGVAPGEYLAMAFDELGWDPVSEPGLLKTYERSAVKVTAREDGQSQVELKLISTEE
ncbi:MAG: carboxypeptidase regulatory-like domain-containing protein [Bryobacterales bacterium]|nr:carboxypeptidase regulatory-like domain-containing protein [Bryobacterales bacterium]